jgi:hypothetical protein
VYQAAIFSNTYDINTGYKGVASSVLLKQADFPGKILIQHLLHPDEGLRLSTLHLSALIFPMSAQPQNLMSNINLQLLEGTYTLQE